MATATTSFVITESSADEISGVLNFCGESFKLTFVLCSSRFVGRVIVIAEYDHVRKSKAIKGSTESLLIERDDFVFEFSVEFSDSFDIKSFTVIQFMKELNDDEEEELTEIDCVQFYL